MHELSELTRRARAIILEDRSKGAKEAQPSKNPAEDCLIAANLIRDCLKGGDEFETAVKGIADAASLLAAASKDLKAKRAAMDVVATSTDFEKFLKKPEAQAEDATVGMKRAVDQLYAPFAQARQTLYSLAHAWEIEVAGHSAGKGSKSKDVKAMTDEELASGIEWAAKNLVVSIRDFLEKGGKAQKVLRDAAKKQGVEKKELTDAEKKAVIDAGLAFKMSADPLYGRARGIARRAVEMLDRARELEKYEAKSKKLKIEFAFDDDPELSDLEIV